ncbi:MAG: ABC transporter permease [Sulfurimonas sp.]|jgi:putative ABC transport system permease protein|nr:ABC transporter permease [Sulfurimonas sp.]
MLWNAFLLAAREIRRNVLRSILTILGIVIGVASVIAMVMLGDSTTAKVTSGISKLGSNMLTILPGQERRGPPTSGQTKKQPFDMDDVQAIQREISGIKAVAPMSTASVTAVYGNENYSTTAYGTNNDYFIVKDWVFTEGEVFNSSELNAGKSVCIIGESVRKELFGSSSPIGEKIRLGAFSCIVKGLLASKGNSSFGMDQDDLIVVPLKMLQRRLTGSQDISNINISVKDGISSDSVTNSLRLLLRERRNIKENEEENFYIRDMKDIIETLSSTTGMLTMLLGAVAAISLVVGGIGIMNIMLVSVTERTREIGIRLAIGAFEREVLLQFLVESVVLSALGGIVGIILGLLITFGVTTLFELPFIFNEGIVVIAFVFSTLIGIIFGYFPAKKAANLNPIDALRHE